MHLTKRCCLSSAVLSLLVVCHAGAADWKPAPGPLTTPWTKDVSPANALPEYPRPQMVRDGWVNLNGLWDYAIKSEQDEQPQEFDGQILVPYPIESALSGVKKAVQPNQKLWYRRTFERPELAQGGRLLLHFDAVDWKCQAWVNGQEVGSHSGGFDAFTFDVTDAVQAGENELVVAVVDPTDRGYQPRGKQVLKPEGIWYTAVTGIWQTVWLEAVPASYIRALKITPDVDGGVAKITVDGVGGGGKVRITASDAGGEAGRADGAVGAEVAVPIKDAKLWSPDAPHLYDLKIELLDGDQVVDTVGSYVGMRKIEVKKDAAGVNRLMLNDQALFQYGPLDQGWWPDGLYTPATDEALKYDIEMTKKFGMNMARKHVKVELPRWYYWCDKLGLLVWQDMPSSNVKEDSPESKENFRKELKALVDHLHNYPSIVMWVPFNEGWGQHDTPEVVAWMQQYEPTRPVNEASGWTDNGSGDVSDMHNYPGPGMRPVEEERVVVLGEFGGLGMPVKGHTWQDEKNWGYVSYQNSQELTDAYVKLLTNMRPLIAKGLSAAVYTQTSDVEIEVNGLMTYDRRIVKLDLDRSAAAARRLYEPLGKLSTLVPTSQAKPLQWRYTTTAPAGEWTAADYDDSSWKTGPGGFGTKGTPGSSVGTEWDGREIWLRRTFELEAPPRGEILLNIHHDEDAEVYFNGQQVAKLPGHTSSYQAEFVEGDAGAILKQGKNLLAVHCRQTRGGQYIDVGIDLIAPAKAAAARTDAAIAK